MTGDIDPAIAALLSEVEASIEPVPTEWPDPKVLCCHYSAAMQNLPGYRQGMATAGIVDLAYEFAVMVHLVRMLNASGHPVATLVAPAMTRLRDICAAEGARRGVMLAEGDDISVVSLAGDLMDEMLSAYGLPLAAGDEA